MTTAYTSLLGLALPVTGELSGTWGDTVNNSITSLLDSAIAGTTTITSDADVTLTTTTGSANTSRQAIILWTAGGTATRTIIAPAQSKIYTVINSSSSTQSIILAGAGPTSGVTIAKGESALCAWNGSDFIKISNTAGPGTFTNLTVTGNTSLGDADTDTITQAASYVTGTQLKSAKTATNTLSLAAYDVDGTAYTNLITLTAANTPTLALTSTGVGTINNMSIGATTASTGAFTTLTSNGATTFTAGTASTTTGTGTLVITGGLGVSGRINAANFDGIIGANTAAAGSFTTLSATGQVSSTANNAFFGATPTTATEAGYININNTGGAYYVGANNSTGSTLSGTAYSLNLTAPAGKVVENVITGTGVITKVSSTGLEVTGTLSATGVVSGSNFSSSAAGFSVGPAADSYQTGLQIFGSGGGGSAYKVMTLANNVTVTTVTSTGLGIGTTSPSTGKFSDASYALLNQSVSTSTGTNIFSSNSDNTKFIGLWSGHSGADSAIGVKSGTTFTFGAWAAIDGTGGFTEWARLNSAGNYSIGGFTANAWGTNFRAINLFSSNALGLAGSDYGSQVTNNCYIAASNVVTRVGAAYGAGRYEQFDGGHLFYGDAAGAAGAYTPTLRMALYSSGQLQFPTTPFGTAQISNTYSTSLANGATVDFALFSGMIIVSNYSSGSVGVFITGGGAITTVATIGGTYGTVTYPGTFDGYRFTNNTGSTYTFSFTAIRYRPNA
jgi:hypothetical protein